MAEFRFRGCVPPSKSLLNRALIVRSHSDVFKVFGDSEAEDVMFLRKALGKVEDGKEFYLGDGGTTLRFFALRASREKGTFVLRGGARLFQRPQGALVEILQSLGVQSEITPQGMVIRSQGWRDPGGPLFVPTGQSSQFVSSLVLNSWNLPFDLILEWKDRVVSEPYFAMTLALCQKAGLEFERTERSLRIPAGQKPRAVSYRVEPDFSSMFSLAAAGAIAGQAVFEDLPGESLQPDFRFFEILENMGSKVTREGDSISVASGQSLKAIDVDLGDCPDLAPVLSVLCAFAQGTSILRGAKQLKFKESDRISSTASLLKKMGVTVRSREDGLEIDGDPNLPPKEFDFDPDEDHRLAMAAGVLIAKGWPVHVMHPEVVNKSFPEYWRAMRAGPHLIIGHRGTGKTSFLGRQRGTESLDLDAELERENSQSVFEIMKNRGEEVFRHMEIALAKRALEKASPQTWLASGAGLRLDEVQPSTDVLWLRRDTDREGRVFLDRPRLDPQTDPLAEFRERAKLRDVIYSKWATREYTVPEGLSRPDEIENRIIFGDLHGTGGAVTLTPRHRKNIMQLGADLYELRDDLLDPDEIRAHFGKIPAKNILYSVRKNKTLPYEVEQSGCLIDWGLEAGYPDREEVKRLSDRLILSSHGTMKEALLDFRLFSKHQVRLKLSPLVESFEDLKAGHLWWTQDPERRTFLPRSSEGRWGWYRLWMKGRSFLNFWREGAGSAWDQPTLWQWLATPAKATEFAAVLGSPVHHSWTPLEHRQFFASRGMPVWAIDIREGEWTKALSFLEELGLKFAAVTSPLKGRAFRSSQPTPRAAELGSTNTLAWDAASSSWKGDNTDLLGLQKASEGLPQGDVAIWGGGGTLPVVGKVFPKASAYSSRAGHVRQGSSPLQGSPSVLVWAAPRSADLIWPPSTWKPEVVFDLNYKEDSPGREYALKIGAKYRSGEAMFRAQAQGQREFWMQFLGGQA